MTSSARDVTSQWLHLVGKYAKQTTSGSKKTTTTTIELPALSAWNTHSLKILAFLQTCVCGLEQYPVIQVMPVGDKMPDTETDLSLKKWRAERWKGLSDEAFAVPEELILTGANFESRGIPGLNIEEEQTVWYCNQLLKISSKLLTEFDSKCSTKNKDAVSSTVKDILLRFHQDLSMDLSELELEQANLMNDIRRMHNPTQWGLTKSLTSDFETGVILTFIGDCLWRDVVTNKQQATDKELSSNMPDHRHRTVPLPAAPSVWEKDQSDETKLELQLEADALLQIFDTREDKLLDTQTRVVELREVLNMFAHQTAVQQEMAQSILDSASVAVYNVDEAKKQLTLAAGQKWSYQVLLFYFYIGASAILLVLDLVTSRRWF